MKKFNEFELAEVVVEDVDVSPVELELDESMSKYIHSFCRAES